MTATPVSHDSGTGATTYQLSGTDPDSDAITYTATATNGAVVRNPNGTFTYTPTDPATVGTVSFYATTATAASR